MSILSTLYILFFLILLCFFPLITVILVKNKHNYIFSLFILAWFILYILTVMSLTLLDVVVNKNVIVFVLPDKVNFFSYQHCKPFNVYNLLINFALVLPLGIIIFCKYLTEKENNKLKSVYLENYLSISFCAGLILGLIIETLQFVLPCNRYSEIADVLFNATGTVLSFFITFLYYKLVSLFKKLKK